MILVDTNVLLDLATSDPVWKGWSLAQLKRAALEGPIVINPVIYAELAARYSTIRALEDFIAVLDADFLEIPKSALFQAGKAFQRYRKQGGTKTGVLSDFFIGAHVAVAAMPLLTRDRARYATYFPTVHLIAPDPS